jgi:uncharacterized protein YodC (DUF2158 family)
LVQVGDTVKLKSGGPHMTVAQVYNHPATRVLTAKYTWFEGTEQKAGMFPAAGVVAVQTEGVSDD